MAYFGPPAPFQLYAYAPMPISNHEIYAVYPSGSHPAQTLDGSQFYYEPTPKNSYSGKHFNRKDSADSGISGTMSRKTSTNSNISISSIMEEPSEDTIKEEQVYVEPDEDLSEKITQQVEFYFSDANITKDKFLLKHVKRNKEGFVSLKLISSFKRVKHLTKDWRQVAHAIKTCSKKLEVNDLETKVRRLEELPPYDETTPSRTVVVLNLPMDRPTIEGVAEIFKACGDIVLVRILRPGNPVPADIKQYVAKHPEMTSKVCALVEFERTEFAQKAVRELNEEEEEKMKVMELTATPLKNGNKKIEARKLAEKAAAMAKAAAAASAAGCSAGPPQRKYSLQSSYNQPAAMMAGGGGAPRARRISLMPNMKFGPICEDSTGKENVVPRKEYALNPNAPSFQMNADGTFQMIPPINHRRRSGNTAMMYMEDGHQYMSLAASSGSRRVSGQFGQFGSAESAAAGLKVPANVVRMPKGPDGKGFNSWCKSRMGGESNNTTTATSTAATTKRASKAIPIVAPPAQSIVTLAESPEEKCEEELSPIQGANNKHLLQVPSINVEAASSASEGSEDEAVVPDKSESCDSGHDDSCSEPDAHDYAPLAAERSR